LDLDGPRPIGLKWGVGPAPGICATAARAAPAEPEPPVNETVVTATTPLHGSHLPRDRVPANVQTVTAEQLAESRSLDLSAYMNDALGNVFVNQVQENPLAPDLQYRGFVASPVLGTPQGMSVYLDGVRLNEPFADTVNWDLIPPEAIRSANLLPGSNPLFGLNTLGGALSIETKTGFSDPGAAARMLFGSFGRKLVTAQAGAADDTIGVFAAARSFDEAGWRYRSPSRLLDGFLSGGYHRGPTELDLSLMAASTRLTGNGPAPEQLLAEDHRAVFTYPDRVMNGLFMVIARGGHALSPHVRLSASAHLRVSQTDTINGDQRDWAACAAPARAGALCATDDDGGETPVVDAAGNPVPFDARYDAADNHTHTRQRSYGVAAQAAVETPVAGRENHLYLGAAVDQGHVRFRSESTVASLDIDRGTISTALLDPTSPVAVDAIVTSVGVYASDTFALRRDLFVTAAARLNRSAVSLEDQLGEALTGAHAYARLNPALGVSYQPRPALGGYLGYAESARAPSPIELTCASPSDPCRLPNGFVADPPLAQVVARTVELGVRGRLRRGRGTFDYVVAGFRTTNSDDIIFISSGSVANRGYFANVGGTQRRGLEAGLSGRYRVGAGATGLLSWSLHYALLAATFETPFSALSVTHPDAVGGAIAVPAGARIPASPRHVGKLGLRWTSRTGLSLGATAIVVSSQYLRGDEANLLAPLPGYVVVGARAAYAIVPTVTVFAAVDNLFDRRYATFGVLGDATEVLGPTFTNPRFVSPAAPRALWVGLEIGY
jgi:iron complex outermembrane receptor protein